MTIRSRSWTPQYFDSVSRRRFLKGAAGAIGAVALIACGGGGSKSSSLQDAGDPLEPGSVWFEKDNWKLPDESKAAVKGGIYRGFTAEGQDGHYDAIMLMSSQVPFSAHVHQMLMAQNRGPGIDPASDEASSPVGALAEGWEISPDGLTVTYTMRQGVKWHPIAPVNGRVMDMDDWKTSQERHLAGGVYRNAIAEILSKVEFPDARHMTWKLSAPYAPIVARIFDDKFAFPIQPKELNANTALAEQTAIGTGYKILDKYQPAIGFEYRKNPEYWEGEPFIDRWKVPIIPEYANRYAQFINGNVIDFTPTAKDVLLMHRDAPNAVIVAQPIDDDGIRRFRFGRQNPDAQAWADPRVRVAMRRSIDFKTIGDFLANRSEFERNGIALDILTETHLGHHPAYWLDPEKGDLGKVSGNYLYDVGEAMKLISAAGLQAPVPLRYPVRLDRGELVEEDLLMYDSFRAAGTFRVDIERVATAAEYNKYRIDGLFDGLLGSGSGGDEPDYLIMRDYHSAGRPAPDRQAYPDKRIDALGEAQRRELDVPKRNQLLRDIQVLLGELMPTIPAHHQFTEFRFRWPWLHNTGYAGSGSPSSGRPVQGGHLQWLDSAMPGRNSGAS